MEQTHKKYGCLAEACTPHARTSCWHFTPCETNFEIKMPLL